MKESSSSFCMLDKYTDHDIDKIPLIHVIIVIKRVMHMRNYKTRYSK